MYQRAVGQVGRRLGAHAPVMSPGAGVLALALLVCQALPPPGSAQPASPPDSITLAPPELVDRILAIVDEEPILLSDLEREVALSKLEISQGGGTPPEDDSEIRARVLEQLVESKLLIAAAKQAEIKIEDEEVEREVAANIDQLLRHFGSQSALDRELQRAGMTLADYRARSMVQVRDRQYASAVVRSFVRPKIEVLENEIRDYYQAHAAEIPAKSDSVTLAIILIPVQPAAEVQRELQRKLTAVQDALSSGQAFADVARAWSEDPTARRGGVVGTVLPGSMYDQRLDEVVSSLEPGQVSGPIQTERGLHILRLDAVTDEGRAISQIFFPVKVEASDVERARRRAEDVHRRLLSGEPFAKVALEESADPRTAPQGGHLGSFRQDDLPPKFQEALQGVAAGQITPPFATPAGFTILQVKERIAGRAYSYDEVRETLRRALEGEKLEAELTKYVDSLRQRFFVDLKG